MTHLNIKLNVEELTEVVMKSDMQDMMKYMAVTVFNAYMESERDAHVNAARKSKGGGRLDMRNIFQTFPKKDNADAKGILKKLFKSPTRAHALANKAEFEALAAADARFGAALQTLDAGFEDAMQYLAEPQPYHVSLRTTNSLERINREVRRRERVIGIFPNAASAERLLGAVLMDVHASLGTPGRRMFMRNDIYSGQ